MEMHPLRGLRKPLFVGFLAVLLAACEPSMPDDLDSLIAAMDTNSETIYVAAANKISTNYGKAGLLKVLETGTERAKFLAPRWLVRFADAEVEQALCRHLRDAEMQAFRINLLWTLRDIGTGLCLGDIEKIAAESDDSSVRSVATDALTAIRERKAARR